MRLLGSIKSNVINASSKVMLALVLCNAFGSLARHWELVCILWN